MRTCPLFLLVVLAALTESGHGEHMRRAERELLLRSKRRWVLTTIEITEEEPGPYPKLISKLFNQKKGEKENSKFRISGKGVTEEPLDLFYINELSGEVFVKGPIDRESHQLFHLKFQILDKATNEEIDEALAIDVEIHDINDNAPRFKDPHMTVNVKENTPEGSLPVDLNIFDDDKEGTPNSEVTISMISQDPAEPKIELNQLNNQKAQLIFKGCFNYDKARTYKVLVKAEDKGEGKLSSTATITLNVVDTNTHPPKFKNNQYKGEVLESATPKDVLRVAVEDKDTPETPAWRAKYFFIDKTQEKYFQIETDPKTNEGILNVIKGQDFEKASVTTLEIGVENEEPLFVCGDVSTGTVTLPPPNRVTVTMKVIDINDKPRFENDKDEVNLKEEEEPGQLLFTPEVHDDESDKIRYLLLQDPAHWVTVDETTGKITSTQKMDRESPFVDEKGNYKVVISAIDDGTPPASSTATIVINLQDINDNTPKLVNKSVILCGNKGNKVMVPAQDSDDIPYSGPFTFSLIRDVENLNEQWKLDPAPGMEGGLVSLKPLPYGKYAVPLEIQDRQAIKGQDTVEVTVCDCGEADVCRAKGLVSSSLGAGAIGLIFLGLLIFLLLLLLFICKCGERVFKPIPILDNDGYQSIINYNQEGGGAVLTDKPTLLLPSSNGLTVADGLTTGQIHEVNTGMIHNPGSYNTTWSTMNYSNMSQMEMAQWENVRKLGGQNTSLSTKTSMRNSYRGGSTNLMRSFSVRSKQLPKGYIEKRVHKIDGEDTDHPMYQPYGYAYEGEGSRCQSLDEITVSNLGDDLEFLNQLGPKFTTLGKICHQTVQDNTTQI